VGYKIRIISTMNRTQMDSTTNKPTVSSLRAAPPLQSLTTAYAVLTEAASSKLSRWYIYTVSKGQQQLGHIHFVKNT
jgi:hypothetical protein